MALLSTDAIGGLQEAYPNYFVDSEMFLQYINIIEATVQLIIIKKRLNQIISNQDVKNTSEIV